MNADVIIVGGGVMGTAAAVHLAARGRSVRLFEQFALAHDRGSSHGLTRIIRLAYFEHPSYVPLLRRAFSLWRDLEARTGEPLLHVTGSLDVGPLDSQVFEGALRSCRTHDLPHEVLSGAELLMRYPAWNVDRADAAVWQPDGGFLEAERCVMAQAAAARQAGASIHEHEPVIEWTETPGGVRVRTAHGDYQAEQLVLAAGPWLPRLLPDLAGVLRPERQVLGWFGIRSAARSRFAPERFPVFVHDAAEGRFYGFPEHERAGFKIGRYHHLGESADPDAPGREVRAADEAALRVAVARYFPDANGPLLHAVTCLFTNTPDEHFVIDRYAGDASPLIVVSPCSGHGFKFAPVVGEIVADLATTNRTGHDITPFRLARLRSSRAD